MHTRSIIVNPRKCHVPYVRVHGIKYSSQRLVTWATSGGKRLHVQFGEEASGDQSARVSDLSA